MFNRFCALTEWVKQLKRRFSLSTQQKWQPHLKLTFFLSPARLFCLNCFHSPPNCNFFLLFLFRKVNKNDNFELNLGQKVNGVSNVPSFSHADGEDSFFHFFFSTDFRSFGNLWEFCLLLPIVIYLFLKWRHIFSSLPIYIVICVSTSYDPFFFVSITDCIIFNPHFLSSLLFSPALS